MPQKHAITWLKRWVGDEYARPAPKPRPKVNQDTEDRERQQKIEQAKTMWDGSDPLAGSPSETYLASRAIPAGPWPDAVRHLPFKRTFNKAVYRPGLIVKATNAAGDLVGVQVVALDDAGKKIKRNCGPVGEGAVRFKGSETGPLALCEGQETGLTVWRAIQVETWAALGSMSKIDLSDVPLERPIWVMADDDPLSGGGRNSFLKAVKDWKGEGRTVQVIYATDTRQRNKQDLNDLAQREGIEAVARRVQDVTRCLDRPVRETLESGRKALKTAVSHFFSDVSDDRVHLIRAELGLGKTTETMRQLVEELDRSGGTAVVAVPTHRLANDLIATLREIEPGAAVWRGREQEADGEPMCHDLDAVRLAQDARADVQKAACDDGQGNRCPFFDGCRYQAQKVQQARIWITPHALLFHELPTTISKPSYLVIDESFWQQALNRSTVSADEIMRDDIVKAGNRDDMAGSNDLHQFRRKLLEALPDEGRITREKVIAAGITAEDCQDARKLEWKRKVVVDLHPGMGRPERELKARQARRNRTITPLVGLWHTIEDALSDEDAIVGRAEVYWHEDHPKVSVGIRSDIRKGWKAPTLLLDATGELDLVRQWFPQVEKTADIRVEAPHQRIVQYPHKSCAHSWFRDGDDVKQKAVAEIWGHCLRLARQQTGTALVIVPKFVEDTIRSDFKVPEWVSLTHHNATRGVDAWRNVSTLIVVGRPMPGPTEAEWRAEALTGKAVQKVKGYYPPADARVLVGGEPQVIETERHPDPMAELIRWHICEAEIIQEIGRGRGVQRRETEPLVVHLLNNVAVGEVDEITALSNLSPDDEMLARHGIILDSDTDAAEAGLWHSDRSLRDKRRRWSAKPNKNSYKEMRSTSESLALATYQRAGPGRKQQVVRYDPRDVPDIEVWLRERLGELVAVRVEELPKVTRLVLKVTGSRSMAVPENGSLPADIRDKLEEIRRGLGLSQADFARQYLGLSQGSYANIRRGHDPAGPAVMSAVRTLLDRPPAQRQLTLAGAAGSD